MNKAWIYAALAPACVFAQQDIVAETPREKIEVTGTNIRRVDTETPAPVQIITRKDIEMSGKQTLADVLQDLPANNNGAVTIGFGTGFAPGGTSVSLRGLSSGSTLVLINGRRTAPYGLADDLVYDFVNLNTIPFEAVERIEVLKDGASAIYGSDAIAGVVNIILRSDYQGATIRGSWGTTRYNDGNNGRVSITAGKGDLAKDGHNVFVNVDAAKRDAIWYMDRKSRQWIGDPDIRQWGYSLIPQLSGAGLVNLNGYIVPDTGRTTFVGGNLYGAVRDPATLQFQQLPGCVSSYPLSPGMGGCLWAPSDWSMIMPEQKSLSVLGRGVIQVTSAIQAYLEAGVYEDSVKYARQPSVVTGIWLDPSTLAIHDNTAITLGAGHPDNPFGMPARLRYSTGDVGGLRREQETTVKRLVAGVKGSSWDWDFDTAFFYSESDTQSKRFGALRNSVLRSVLDGTSPLGYYRLGANAYLNSPELYAALSPTLEIKGKGSVTSLDIKATRELMQLAGGPMALAIGAETRRERIDLNPPPLAQEGDIVGFFVTESHLQRRVSSLYGELYLPAWKDVEVSAAVRVDRYSDYGRSTTPKLGIKWTPIRQLLLLRGTYSEGFRAPGAAESGNSVVSGVASGIKDPVRCPVTGASEDCDGGGQVTGQTVGTTEVKPQESKSYTAGFVFEPVRNASITVDYWRIKRKNDFPYIDDQYTVDHWQSLPGVTLIRDDNNLPGIPNSGTLLGIITPFPNAGKTDTSGFDVDVRYRFDPGEYGRVSIDLLWTYINNYTMTLPYLGTVEFVGTHGPTILTSDAGTPRNRGTLTLTWEKGPWTASSTTSYVSSVKNVEYHGDPNGCLTVFADGRDAPDNCRIGSFTTTSLFGRYRWSNDLEVFGSVQNLFDRIAPLDVQTYGLFRFNVAYHMPGAIGRQFTIGARYTFK